MSTTSTTTRSATERRKVHVLVHTAAMASAAVGAGLAHLPGSDAPVLMAIQTAMIMGIAEIHGQKTTKAAAADLLLTLTATLAGRGISRGLLRLIPVLGTVINSMTAAGLTEAAGWGAAHYFRNAKQPKTPPGKK